VGGGGVITIQPETPSATRASNNEVRIVGSPWSSAQSTATQPHCRGLYHFLIQATSLIVTNGAACLLPILAGRLPEPVLPVSGNHPQEIFIMTSQTELDRRKQDLLKVMQLWYDGNDRNSMIFRIIFSLLTTIGLVGSGAAFVVGLMPSQAQPPQRLLLLSLQQSPPLRP
jgi:hypothetical protein